MTPQGFAAVLGYGRTNAKTYDELADALRVSKRELVRHVQTLRLEGWPVASGDEGVWIADSGRDMEATYWSLRHRIKSQTFTMWAVRRTMRKMRSADLHIQQETLWDV